MQLTLKNIVLMVLMLVSAGLGAALHPTIYLADKKPKINLAAEVPIAFGDWIEDNSITPVLPNPEVQAKLNALYSATLARTYRNKDGQRVMLSIAYGSDQSSDATQVHRPEFCYSAQGFQVSNRGQAVLNFNNQSLVVQRLVGVQGRRYEPITYWITLNESATLPGFGRKLAQIRYGLNGEIPDGLLFRVSSITPSDAESFELQDQFLRELAKAMDPRVAPRYFGTSR